MLDDKITKLREEISAIRTKRSVDRKAHQEACVKGRRAFEFAQHRIQTLLKCRLNYKQMMLEVHGGLNSAPPRYALDLQVKLLSLVHQEEVRDKERKRRKKYKTMLKRYMTCEKNVLLVEKQEMDLKVQSMRPKEKPKKEASFRLKDLSPSSFFKPSFKSQMNSSWSKLMGNVSAPVVWVQATQE